MIIAIDGPAASGKGTLAKRLANHYGFKHLDTGLLYRAVGRVLLAQGHEPENTGAAVEAANQLDLSRMNVSELRTENVGVAASKVASIPEVRKSLLNVQRDFALSSENAILDGRDIGTIVCPEADVKFFVTASPEVRASRRVDELRKMGVSTTFDQMFTEIRNRDKSDSEREIAPLKRAEDAHLIDTSELDIEMVFARAVKIVDSHCKI